MSTAQTASCVLGSLLTDSVNNNAEVLNRIAMAFKTAKQMKLLWNKANTSIKWKLQVFNAIVKAKIWYGLESI